MSFLSSLFGGSNPTLNTQIPALTGIGGTATTNGLSDVNDAASFFQKIMKGDYSVLAPQTSAIQKQGQQKIQSQFQFGNRSGGTNASAQMTGDTTRSSINDLIAQLTGTGATSLASVGSGLLSTGIRAYGDAADESQQQMKNWKDSLLGTGITGGLSTLESFGLGKGLK